uniref:Uncharacterized protein n=1 Tax=Arundo donax TaxID=35708 RepID=A0A0A9CIH4_ARUDO
MMARYSSFIEPSFLLLKNCLITSFSTFSKLSCFISFLRTPNVHPKFTIVVLYSCYSSVAPFVPFFSEMLKNLNS